MTRSRGIRSRSRAAQPRNADTVAATGPPPSRYAWLAAMRRHGGASLGVASSCGGLAILVLVVMLLSGHQATVCNSGPGQFGGTLGQTVARDCSHITAVHVVAVVALVALMAGCLIATLTHLIGGLRELSTASRRAR